jgi:flagellar basal-body rod modification protein FlgD
LTRLLNLIKEQKMLASDIANLVNQTTLQTPVRTPSPEIDKNGFLQLLTKQLSQQDPLNPMDNNEFVSQLAQFGSLEQQINLNESFTKLLGLQQLTQGAQLIGKEVICLVRDESGTVGPLTGTVEQVMLINGDAYIKLSTGDEVSLDSVVSVESGSGS